MTLEKFKRHTWVDISMDLQEYTFASRWFKDKKKPEKGGTRLNWKLRVDNQGNAKHSGLYGVDNLGRKKVMDSAKQEWSKQVVGYTYDIDEEEFQSGPETIIDTMLVNEQGLYNDFFKLMETSMWTAPADDDLEDRPPSGIPFWIQKTATLGFNGGDPSGFSNGAGQIKTSKYPKWSNYGGTYDQVDRDDLIEKVVNACDFCHFKAPHKYNELGGGEPDWAFYTVHGVLASMRRQLSVSNDNLGDDVAKHSGTVYIRSIPVIWVPALTEPDSDAYDSTSPFYGLNWKKFQYFFKTGRNMVKHPPKQAAHQHTVRERYCDNWGNFACFDRRQGGFVFYQAS